MQLAPMHAVYSPALEAAVPGVTPNLRLTHACGKSDAQADHGAAALLSGKCTSCLGQPAFVSTHLWCASKQTASMALTTTTAACPHQFTHYCYQPNSPTHCLLPTSINPTGADLKHLISAAGLAGASAGLTQPHPNAACILVAPDGRIISSAHQRAHGSAPAEVLAVSAARDAAAGATAYLNLESGDCHGEDAAVQALIQSGVSRVVVGLRHPLRHLRNQAVRALRAAGVRTDVLGEAAATAAGLTGALIVDAASSGAAGWGAAAAVEGEADGAQAALVACLKANEGLLHRAVLGRPMSILKYAMTLDGKIATASGHAAWVSSPASRCVRGG